MKTVWAFLLASIALLPQSQNAPKPVEPGQAHRSIADFGLNYPLSNDWIRATQLMRKKVESADPAANYDVLLAAVFVPKSSITSASPFFSVLAYRQPATDCKRSLEAMVAKSQGEKEKFEANVVEFSAAGRDYFRATVARGSKGHHRCMICSSASGHLLIWNANAANEKGLETVVATLEAITPLRQPGAAEPTPQKEVKEVDDASKPAVAKPEKVKISSGVTQGLLIKRVDPIYPADARTEYIQGVVVLQAEISKAGDIADLELLDGPIELAGSAVAAVRQWKYRPYLLLGQPVAVQTQIQVNYLLRR